MYFKSFHLAPITFTSSTNWIALESFDTDRAVRLWLSGPCRKPDNTAFTSDSVPQVTLNAAFGDSPVRPCWQSAQSDRFNISILVDPLVENAELYLQAVNVSATAIADLTAVVWYE